MSDIHVGLRAMKAMLVPGEVDPCGISGSVAWQPRIRTTWENVRVIAAGDQNPTSKVNQMADTRVFSIGHETTSYPKGGFLSRTHVGLPGGASLLSNAISGSKKRSRAIASEALCEWVLARELPPLAANLSDNMTMTIDLADLNSCPWMVVRGELFKSLEEQTLDGLMRGDRNTHDLRAIQGRLGQINNRIARHVVFRILTQIVANYDTSPNYIIVVRNINLKSESKSAMMRKAIRLLQRVGFDIPGGSIHSGLRCSWSLEMLVVKCICLSHYLSSEQ